MTNQPISDQLGLTIGTVKFYLRRLYVTLDVSSRTQALARARALELLR